MQRLFFQITITLNPIIIHKLWEKNFHQSWWEIKVRRPRHGHDSIFPNTLQRPPLGHVPVTRFKSLTFSLWLWPGDVSEVTPRRCEAKWRPLLVWPERSRSLFTGARHGAGARFQRHLAPGDWPLLLRRRRTRRATEQTHFSQIILRILLEYDMLIWSQEGGLMTDGFPLNQNTPVWCQCFVLEQIVIPSDF